ncbi:MAG TPA: hypothetical protein VHE81_02190 [Lacipirellulaceae bacterium]|nr:hypothetical protein [Lacipirellulaceae bacterium]
MRGQNIEHAETIYSAGVQAYFDGNLSGADAYLSRYLALDPNDPRAYYFRAICRFNQGRGDEARTDMQVGADIEAHSPNRFDIGKALERVQGSARLLLERYRTSARLKSALSPPPKPVSAPDSAVLRERRIVPLDEFSRSSQPRSFPAPEPPAPTESSPARPGYEPSSALSNPAAAASNPFGDDAAVKTSPSASKKAPLPPPPKAPAAKTPLPPPPKSTPPAENVPADDSNPFN